MSRIAGKDVVLTIDGNSQPATDINFGLSADELDVTNITSVGDWREFISGFKSGEFSYSYFFDDTDVAPLGTYLGATVPYVATYGAYAVNGNLVILTMDLATDVDGVTKWDITSRITGQPTEVTT